METLIPGMIAALSAGALAVGKDLGGAVVKDAYAALKTVIADRYKKAGAALEAMEEDPESELEQQVLEKRLNSDNAAADPELATLTQSLLTALNEMKDNPAAAAVLNFKKLEAAGSFELDNIEASGTVLKAETATFSGDFKASNIRQKN